MSNGDDMVRGDDPDSSHDARSRVRRARDRKEIFEYWCQFESSLEWICTLSELQFSFLPTIQLVNGFKGSRRKREKSLTRRASDVIVREKKPGALPEVLRLLEETGIRFDGAIILTLTAWGKRVRDNPELMIPHWSARTGIEKPKRARKKKDPWAVDLEPPPWSGWEI